MLKLVIYLLRLLNLTYYHFSLILEKFGKPPLWAQEVGRYFKLSPQKILNLYHQKRPQAAKLWHKTKRNTQKKIFSFYQETDYFIFRQHYFHRHKVYLDMALPLLIKTKGSLCEYGGGIGPMTNWLIKLFPHWRYTIADLDCPVLKFAKWRFKNNQQVSFKTVTSKKLPLTENYDVILCKHVIEHVPNPLKVVKHLISYLKPGGWLFIDFVYDPGEENLQSAAKQRNSVLNYLKASLTPIFTLDPKNPADGYGLYIKSK